MIKIDDLSVYGFAEAIIGMRNPKNSWDLSDSQYVYSHAIYDGTYTSQMEFMRLGDKDFDLMKRLASGGPVHAKYRRFIDVYCDITAPLYWWKEFDTYKIGTVANSCSTMHKIHAKEFTVDDFSHEHLLNRDDMFNYDSNFDWENEPALTAIEESGRRVWFTPSGFLQMTCQILNHYRELYLETKDKRYWWQMIQLLPSSYNQKRTIKTNYETLSNIYASRKDHKLDEWREFCAWIETLPYAKGIIFGGEYVES